MHLFGDGNFQYCAKYFHQLYTLHAKKKKNGQYVPSVFFLLPCKSKECYVSMFKHLLDSCARYNLSLNVSYIHFYFEVAVHDAAKEFCPDVSIKACQFHLSQAWYRKIQNLGLSPEYQNHESETGQWLKNFLGLCFLDPAEEEDCFVYDIQVTYQCTPSHVSVTGPSRLILGGNFSKAFYAKFLKSTRL